MNVYLPCNVRFGQTQKGPGQVELTESELNSAVKQLHKMKLKPWPSEAAHNAGFREPYTPYAMPTAVKIVVQSALPEDIPGKAALEVAGLLTIETVPTHYDDLLNIDGIGRSKAKQIEDYLAHIAATEKAATEKAATVEGDPA